jgi:hypothetical protein
MKVAKDPCMNYPVYENLMEETDVIYGVIINTKLFA